MSIIGGLMALVISFGGVLAQSTDTPEGTPKKNFAAIAAGILGLEQGTVENALKQARREMADEGVKARLDRAVTKGLLEQGQADSYLAWWQARPDGPSRFPAIVRHAPSHSRFHAFGGYGRLPKGERSQPIPGSSPV